MSNGKIIMNNIASFIDINGTYMTYRYIRVQSRMLSKEPINAFGGHLRILIGI